MGRWKGVEEEERHPFLEETEEAPALLVKFDSDGSLWSRQFRAVTEDELVDDTAVEEIILDEPVVVDDEIEVVAEETPVIDEPVVVEDEVVEFVEAIEEFETEAMVAVIEVEKTDTGSISVGDEINAIIEFARNKAGDVVERARREADEWRTMAENEAATVLRQAEETAKSMRKGAEDEAKAVRAAAEADALSLRNIATDESNAITQSAKSMREEAQAFQKAARDEAEALLESARATLCSAENKAAEMVGEARREVDRLLNEMAEREAQLNRAKHEAARKFEAAQTALKALQDAAEIGDAA